MTRAEIRNKYGISQLETSDIAFQELSDAEAKEYEGFIIALQTCINNSLQRYTEKED